MNNRDTNNACIIIGIAGPSGAGKSFLAQHLIRSVPELQSLILSQDHYYRDRSDLSLERRQHINYDHPDAIEFSLFISHLRALRQGKIIEHPLYDFSRHNRRPETQTAGPADLVIVDGILLFAIKEVLPLFDLKIYVDTPLDLCFIRRLQRDVMERGRTMESVIQQYLNTVRPMFLEFVNKSHKVADIIVSGEERVENVIPEIRRYLAPLHPAFSGYFERRT